MADLSKLEETLRHGKRLNVFLHDNPDPDCMAAGWLLVRIAEHLGLRAHIYHGGTLGRAENRAMVRLLKIPLRALNGAPVRWQRGDCNALVDTQPGTGNNSFPPRLHCHIVIDHHPPKKALDAPFVDVRPDVGCCTTMVLAYHQALGLPLDPSLATAVAYAIASETQDLEREATRADREAYQRVFPLVHLEVLGKIRHPSRSRAYYRTIARAMQRVVVGRNTCVCHIGELSAKEVVAEVADFLLAMERVSWCLVTGHCGDQMVLSIRTRNPKGHAHTVMTKVLAGAGRGGGHGMIAGGAAACTSEEYGELAAKITSRFLHNLHRRVPEKLRPLLAEPALEEVPGIPEGAKGGK